MRWTFGVEPLPQTLELADLLRRVGGLALSLEEESPAVTVLLEHLRRAEAEMSSVAPTDLAPRIGPDAKANQRTYIDHSRDVGAFNPGFPTYELGVEGDEARGTVTFPLVFEGPPGIVHGGVLATFADCVAQHHNCEVGSTGRTTSLSIAFRRPTPILEHVDFHVLRSAEDRRIRSVVKLSRHGDELCTTTVEALAGDRSRLPEVSPRRHSR